ncbi:MAG: amidohydrolase [Lentimicrobiaceae bacterium]|nr:amidohydrolase [Lentimicrobiaceae bacterium]
MNWQKLEQELITLRHKLHQTPELSDKEAGTAAKIETFARQHSPDQIITQLGGHGIAVLYKGREAGPTLLIRCDMDALPIHETNDDLDYRSTNAGVSHKCGHDGHMAIAAGLLPMLASEKPTRGKVIILFQPAEETGEGARRVINDPQFESLIPDYAFALHNLPGYNLASVIVGENTFASASTGLIVKLNGRTAHAAEPEKAISPALAITQLIQSLPLLPTHSTGKDFALLTIIHAQLGERAFGTTPGYAELMITLRAHTNKQLKSLCSSAEKEIRKVADNHHLRTSMEWVEAFPATLNHPDCNREIIKAANTLNLTVENLKTPFRWSEDFGHFTHHFKGALFGFGSGLNQPELHNPAYNFPDEIILKGSRLFYQIIKQIDH